MRQTRLLIETLKRELKKQQKTYKHVAEALSLSEASVKRLFAEESFSLERLESICELLHLEFIDLVRLMEECINLTSQLTLKQEKELVSDIRLLLMAHFLINGLRFSDITDNYAISETQGIQLLAKLDRMKIIELLPGNRVKMMISNNFQWINRGPIESFYRSAIQPEFFDARFNQPGECQLFVSGMLTRDSNAELINKIKRLANDFSEQNTQDQSATLSQRFGTSLVIAMRPWEPKVFEKLRRGDSDKKF
ncbi:helix-turn-helix transcriptional regulator [Shewanella eurypsychrophilus]|uniref:Helix-turn-helix transcriptional regulator n=1 Tax=Shewanella eurypsychrophilus TaxID=2593656 RepID=A0ABX6VB83_9GAMM|nr:MULTISPECIES: helix-turn-helix transcriptional regulator [Shewanella]QFU24744.1 helix-turn-helix domain-containing protein [Shewanella sp. YLB-09]QPG59934.1 helix-turn-helix transcriptional regulator [Shewanella eurypsychrophilus]